VKEKESKLLRTSAALQGGAHLLIGAIFTVSHSTVAQLNRSH